MKKCKECGFENEKSSKYCKSCGTLLNEDTSKGHLLGALLKTDFLSSAKKVNIKTISIVVVAVLLVGIMFFTFSVSPTEKVAIGLYRFASDDSKEATVHVDFEDYRGFGSDIAEKVKMALYFAKNEKQVGAAMEIFYDDESFYYPKFESAEDKVYIDILEDKDEIYYYEDNAIEELLTSSNALFGYLKDINISSLDEKKYIKIIEEELDDDIYKEGGKVVLEIDLEKALEILVELVDEFKDDDVVIEELHSELVLMIEKMIEEDFEMTIDGETLDDDILEEMLDELEDYDEFEEDLVYELENMQSDIEYELNYISDAIGSMDMTITFDFTITNKIKEMIIAFDGLYGLGDFNIDLDLTKGYRFNKYKESSAEEIDDDDYEILEEIQEDLLDLVADKVDENEALQEDLESLGLEDVDDLMYQLMWMF